MKVLVTGGAGQIGSYMVDRLRHIHDITILDTKASALFPKIPRLDVDLTDGAHTLEAVRGFDAVVHLAAIPNPYNDPGDRVLAVNMASTYNVLEAARQNGISRVIYGCSESASGWGVHYVNYRPQYVPVDEEHPDQPHESYSFSKCFGEAMGREYARAYKLEFISLRYAWVWLEPVREHAEKTIAAGGADDAWFGAHILPEDVAQAVELALPYRLKDPQFPFEAFYLTAEETFCRENSLDVIRRLFGTAIPVRRPGYFLANPRASLFDITKAKRELGFSPEFCWRDFNSPRRRRPGVTG